MADKIKDADDRVLESMFRSDPIADNGFSDRIVRRIRRKIWIRRLTLPVAAAIGVSIAAKPFAGLVMSVVGLLGALQVDVTLPGSMLPSMRIIVLGVIIMLGAIVGLRAATE
ncbi:MAG: hypothetical protein R3358_01535 [Woeseiaceae bacterium]|nr:hypothetical protein [Woeseiaceae bacterium]